MVLYMAKPKNKKEYHVAWNAWERCCKKVDSQGEHFAGIHNRFLRDPAYRESQLAIEWTERKCKELDELAKEDHTYKLTPEEKKKILRTMVSHLEQIRQKWTYGTSIRFLSCCLCEKSSTLRVRRTS